jgi:hypothetical protein
MTFKRNVSTKENREYWEYVQKASAHVSEWPSWMRGCSATVCTDSTHDHNHVVCASNASSSKKSGK